ncbi:zinc finger protein 425-like isoform X2 [Neocloeon triangulifer]|uniref:zinc finger protein 425-like isoform X2 n=1 Tax=Neocloeon triangulifer TaxID=2078957 RepID=UPI00286F6D47|nr:zinc finger protein 425-like isoform X2 [Neocloeon triangulifer]
MFGELCRLCERPAADGGHRAAELDKDKLAEWCLNFLGTTLAEEIDDHDLFCYFCVPDARFYREAANNVLYNIKNCDISWWPEEETDKDALELYKNYTAGNVQQCWVSLEKLPSEENADVGGKAESRFKKNCCYCNKQFVELTQHIHNKHAYVAIKCNYKKNCNKFFKTVEERDAHLNDFHFKPKIETLSDCIYCTRKGLKNATLHKHIKLKHRDVAIRCSIRNCALYFQTQADMDSHFEAKHKTFEENKRYKCSICDYRANTKDFIANHEARIHKLKKLIKCPECPKTCISKCALRSHFDFTHKFRTCPSCNLRIRISKFRKHFIKRFCIKCKSSFDCLELLKKHEKNCKYGLTCALCLKSFRKKYLLKYHMNRKHLIHNGQASNSKTSFNFHQLKGIKLIPKKMNCAHCSKPFSTKRDLKSHLACVHNLIEKNHCCNQCSEKFIVASKLKLTS